MTAKSATASAIAALRAGRAVRIDGAGASLTVLPLETASDSSLALHDPDSVAPLIVSGRRAAALSLANLKDAADPAKPVLIAREAWLDRDSALALADPAQDFARAPTGPLRPLPVEQPDLAAAALRLARSAGLLPALWQIGASMDVADRVAAAALQSGPEMVLVARARLPIDGLPDSQIAAFRASDDGQDHVALIVGAFGGQPPLVRLHSECLTGDVFGSLKCDCGPQMKQALRLIGEAGGGVLLYLRQEGRGIGLANKLRAYALQDRGLDTVEANLRLGFEDDERDYGHAAAILEALGIGEVRLLTNNPAKVEGLERAGIKVAERVAHRMPANPHNADYLAAKKAKSGHLD